MMISGKKTKSAFFCSQCGAEHPKWQGQCRECLRWNTLIEEKKIVSRRTSKTVVNSQKLSQIVLTSRSGYRSGIDEFDRVLGGQLLPGMTILLGGEPGIGKSTLVLQAAEAYSQAGLSVLYITGEESPSQLKLRAERLQVSGERITIVSSTLLEEVTGLLASNSFQVVLVDSIQTIATGNFDSPPGTVGQIRESAHQLIGLAKANEFALFLIGHVTKDGQVAGPKLLEHMVDTVVYFEGDRTHLYRILRASKNRFGSIAEIGLFEMTPVGLVGVSDPSSLFLSDHSVESRTGSVATGICEGSRPILVEVQALVTSASYGNPQRVASGIDNKRLSLLLAILEKRCDLPMANNDVFVSIAGGLRLSEPSLDLPLMVSIASSLQNRPVAARTVVVGEVGLSGEVRSVTMIDRRISEAARLGFTTMILPEANLKQVSERPIELVGVRDIQGALDVVLG